MQGSSQCHIYTSTSDTQRVNIHTDLQIYADMGVRSMRLAFFALVAMLVCSVYAQATEKSAAKIDVGSLSTQEIEEHLQVCLM